MSADSYRVDPNDPRAPPQEVWDRLTPEERAHVIDSLPFEAHRTEEAQLRAELERRLAQEEQRREESERKLAEALAELERLRGGRR